MELSDKKFAVLIDADNISHRKIKDILDEIANYGTPTIKRIYGDFTDPKFAAWKSVLLENSITPIQQYAYTTGKNATDSALIIDAMDILHKESVNGFCIVSSDSDYTRLASRIRESGREVLGFGEKKTPKPFIKSCDKFIYVEILGQPAPAPTTAVTPATAPKIGCIRVYNFSILLYQFLQRRASGSLLILQKLNAIAFPCFCGYTIKERGTFASRSVL